MRIKNSLDSSHLRTMSVPALPEGVEEGGEMKTVMNLAFSSKARRLAELAGPRGGGKTALIASFFCWVETTLPSKGV